MTRRGLFRSALLTLASAAYLLVAGEVYFRFVDGYRFDRLKLTARPTHLPTADGDGTAAARALLEMAWLDHRIDARLFFAAAATMSEPENPEIAERSRVDQGLSGQENYVWNDDFINTDPAPSRAVFEHQKSSTIFAFHSYDGSAYPRFRLYPSTKSNLGLTNRFGWLSPDIAVVKPENTIRIAILGDSTSHNPFALDMQGFFNAWADETHFPFRFELINAARQGLGQDDLIRVLRYEVAPAAPDYVLLTEAPVVLFGGRTLWSSASAVPTDKPQPHPGWPTRETDRLLQRPARWSALARAVTEYVDDRRPDRIEREPSKPSVLLRSPFVNNRPPTIAEIDADPFYRTFIANLDQLWSVSIANHVRPIMTTDRACAFPGMAVARRVDPYLFDAVNSTTYWPLTYAQIQQIVRVNNLLLEDWAKAHAVPTIDVQGLMPTQLELCNDLLHDTRVAQRLRAWIIFQQLVLIIEADLAAGRVTPSASARDVDTSHLEPDVMRLNRGDLVAKFPPSHAADDSTRRQ